MKRPDHLFASSCDGALYDKPCADKGLTSYRAMGRFGCIMIGAKNNQDAMKEAKRSTPHPTDLQVWNDKLKMYVEVEN
jgi:hypothetical protein